MNARPRHVTALAAIIAAAALGVGCGSASDSALRASLSALRTPAATATSTPPPPECHAAVDSLRPNGSVPAPAAIPAGSTMARIRRHGELVAGVDQNTLLLGYLNPTDRRIEGFEIDLLHDLSTALFGSPDKVDLRALSTSQRISAVQSGSVDIVADALSVSCGRARLVDFSTVYLAAGQRVLVPSSAKARSLDDMNGQRVCATKGSRSLTLLQNRYPKVIPYVVEQRTDCLVALQRELVDGITSDDAILLGFKKQDPETKLIGPTLEPELYAMAISRRHPDLVRYVNAVLARMRADGTLQRLYRRWHLGAPKLPTIRYSDR